MAINSIAKIAASALFCAVGYAALTAADASLPDVKTAFGPMILLGFSFLIALVVLVYTSLAVDMRITYQILLVYMVIYLILPGYNHNSINEFPFYHMSYTSDIRFNSALIVLIFVCASFIGNILVTFKPPKSVNLAGEDLIPSAKIAPNSRVALAVTVIAAAMAVAYIAVVGVSFAFSTRSVEGGVVVSRSTAGLFIAFPRIITLIPLAYAIILIRFSTRPRYGWRLLLINLPIILTVNYPPALPRFQLFGNLLLIMVLSVNFAKVRNRAILSLTFIGGAVVGMPIVDHFTRGGGTLSNFNISNIMSSYFKSGDFDGLQSINNAVIYVQNGGIEYGKQIISAFLFFVPRAFWPGKADPTGSITAEAAGYDFLNISQPLPSEIFVDFSYAGVVFGGMIVGAGMAVLDRKIDAMWRYDVRARLIAALTVGYALPLYRGSLLAMIGPFVSVAVAFFILSMVGMKLAKPMNSRAQRGPTLRFHSVPATGRINAPL